MPEPRNAVRLETPRLVLCAITDAHAPDYYRIYSDPECMRYWSQQPAASEQESLERVEADIEMLNAGRGLLWSMLLDGRAIGKCVLFHFDEQNRRAEVGYLLSREYWGQGLASEAMGEMIRHAFEALGLHRLEADTDPLNRASIRLLERLGFEREGTFRDRWRVYGEWQDSAMFGLLKPDWERARA
ncbi:MAG: GNAT family protein [Xanthomonadales bacterium]|nr:GNAT family protein [Xanthomonadales bacterium]